MGEKGEGSGGKGGGKWGKGGGNWERGTPLSTPTYMEQKRKSDIIQGPYSSINNFGNISGNKLHLDIVNINASTKFGEILSCCFQDIELKRNSEINQAP